MDIEIFRYSVPNEVIMMARLTVSVLAGAVIGLERGRVSSRPAGVRTMALVSMGSCAFTLVSIFGFPGGDGIPSDPSRVAAQIVSGVGFLGAGVMIRAGDYVRNLTTAASIWVAAGLGMAAGTGLVGLAIFGALMAFGILRFLPHRYGELPEDDEG
jgi:putative Mg2+ transporter-C (MgtC) family protein